MNDIAQQLERLETLRANGSLSEEEFQSAKKQLLGDDPVASDPVSSAYASNASKELFGFSEPTWCMAMHLSQLFLFAGGIGIVVPIVLWIVSKDKSAMASRHGNRMMNWIISMFIYSIVAGILCMFLIGIPLLVAVLMLQVAFPVIAAVKANEGQLWSYPMAIRFFLEN